MSDFFSKFETFLFDILGLVLPGLIFLLLLTTPLVLFDFSAIPADKLASSGLLSSLKILSSSITEFVNTANRDYFVWLVLICSYILGHVAKVIAIIQYELMEAIFDKSLNKLVLYLHRSLIALLNRILIYGTPLTQTKLFKPINTLWQPVGNTLKKIFTFKSKDIFADSEPFKQKCIEIVNQKLQVPLVDWNYTMYKFSVILFAQENIKTLTGFFLAKYNLYRSLAFSFSIALVYFLIFYHVTDGLLTASANNLESLILTGLGILWFTFHYKYKRYWQLCGNETLMSFYYYLNKGRLNS